MKVLLLGEYSGFFSNLKSGLQSLGIDCEMAANGDGWKNIAGADFNLFGGLKENNKFALGFNRIIYPFFNIKKLYGYDIVYMIGPSPFPTIVNKYLFKKIRKHNKKVYVSIAGGTCSLFESYVDGTLKYYTFDNNPETCKVFDYRMDKNKKRYEQEKYVFSEVDGIIPIMYEYAVGVRKYPNCKKTIPLPFDASRIEYCPNTVNGKIVIMHGVIREKSKGTDIILKALDIIKDRYPDKVEIVVDGKMPLKDYLEKLKTVNILIDQCKEHCYGLNALYAMAEGRIVLGGASYNSLKEFGLKECPVFHIMPSVDQIVEQIENVISKENQFEELGYRSRKFVEEVHDYKKIASEYLRVWKE